MQAWVKAELASVDLGDARRQARVVKLLDQLSRNPQGTFNQACPTAADKKAAYRFFANVRVAPEPILAAHIESTWKRIEQATGRILVVQDTTSLDYSAHRRAQGLGPLEKKECQGLFVHTALALSEAGEPLGLVYQELWAREAAALGQSERRRERAWQEKESYKWQRTVARVLARGPQDKSFVVIGDRESDVYGLLASPRPAGVELLVRSAQNRKVQEAEGLLHAALASGSAAGQVMVEVARGKERTPRAAICEVRYRALTLLPPRHADQGVPQAPVRVWAVAITELHPPNGETPLHWVLLATWPIESLAEAIQCATYYSRRWLVERYHFVLKSGCRIEAAQLRDRARLERLEVVYSIVAWRLLALTYQARLRPEQPCEPMLRREEWVVLYAHSHQKLPPAEESPPTIAQAVDWVAKLGGYWGRKSDAPPGVKVLWRGLQRLQGMVEGFTLAAAIFQQEQRSG